MPPKRNTGDLESFLYYRVKPRWSNTSSRICRFEAGADIAFVPKARRAHTMSRVPAACRSSPQTTCSWVRMEAPISILAGDDGLTKALFADVVSCKGTCHGYAERALAHNVLSTGHQKVILQSDQEPSIIDVKHQAGTHIPTEIVYEESLVGDSNANGSIERANQTIQGQTRTTLNDRLVRRLVSTAQFCNGWHVMQHGH